MTEQENQIADHITKVLSEVIELLGTTDHNRRMWLRCKSALETASLRIGREVPRIDRPKPVETVKPQPLKKAEPVKAVNSDVLAYSQGTKNDPLPKPRKTNGNEERIESI
jgi:hypothetical protein